MAASHVQGHKSWIKSVHFGNNNKWIVTGDKVCIYMNILCVSLHTVTVYIEWRGKSVEYRGR